MRASSRQETAALHIGAILHSLDTPAAKSINAIAGRTVTYSQRVPEKASNGPTFSGFTMLSRKQYERSREAVAIALDLDEGMQALAECLIGLGVNIPVNVLRGELGRIIGELHTAMVRSDYAIKAAKTGKA